MTFEEILPELKQKKKYVRTGWGGMLRTITSFDTIERKWESGLEVTPYFLSLTYLVI